MEVVQEGEGTYKSDLTQVALTEVPGEAGAVQGLLESAGIASILEPAQFNGPMVAYGLLPPKFQRVMVRPEDAEAARELLSEAFVEEPPELLEEPVNATYLEDASGRRARSYGAIGGYARMYAFGLIGMAVIFGGFLLVRAL